MRALEQADRWPVGRVAVGTVDADGVRDVHGDGTHPFPWASVTKPLTALTVLVAWHRGAVDLGEPAGPEGSTVRHLLAHASGLPTQGAEPISPPGRRRIYSNTGFEILADAVAAREDRPFAGLVDEWVLSPLGMAGTRLEGSPAHAAVGPLDDLLALGQELLTPTLLPEERLAQAVDVAFPGLRGVLPGFGRQDPNDWGLGFELRGHKEPHWTGRRNSPRTFGHFGQSGSFLWVDPDAGLALACLCDRDFGEWAADAWPALSDAVLSEHAG